MKNTKKNTTKTSKPNRSAAALKAWETRRKNKAANTTSVTKPGHRLLSSVDRIAGSVIVTYTGSIGDPLTTKLIALLKLG